MGLSCSRQPRAPPPPYASSVGEAWSDVWSTPWLAAGHLRVTADNAHRLLRELRRRPGLGWATIGRHGGVVWHVSRAAALELYNDLLNSAAAVYQQLCAERQLGSMGDPTPALNKLRTFVAAAASHFGPAIGVQHVTSEACDLVCAHYLPGGHLTRGFAVRGATVHVPF